MANCCTSDKSLNTGTPKQSISGAAKGFFLIRKFADDGTENVIDLSTFTGTQIQWDALTQNTDSSKRLYPIHGVKNVEDLKGDSIFEPFNDTSNLFVEEGTRAVSLILPNLDPVFLGKLKSWGCQPMRILYYDGCDNLDGKKSTTTADAFVGVDIDQNTWNVTFVKATDTTVQKINLSFEISRTERDEDLRQIAGSEMTIKPKEVDGLVDVNVAVSGESTTGFTGVATFDYGSCLNPLKLTGAVKADWTLYNDTQDVAITITTADEGPDGTYTFVYPAQTSADVLTLTIALSTGFEVSTTTIVTP